MSDELLRLEGVSHSFGHMAVLRDISFAIKRGEFVALVGPSGCGKTTLLNLIAGFYHPVSGRVLRAGTMRMVYQHDGLFPWLTAEENIALGLRQVMASENRDEQVRQLLSLTRLLDFSNYFPHQLSGGMRRRIELARVLAGEADLLLLDEPFSALDYQTRLRIRRELLRMLSLQPRTVVLVTHDIEEATELADRVFVLSERPTHIRLELRLPLKKPRTLTHPEVVRATETILNHIGLGDYVELGEKPARGAISAVDRLRAS